MSKAIYIATIESDSGKSLVSLGLLRMMLTKSSKVGYFRPIINDHGEDKYDNHTNTAIKFFNLDIDYNDCYAYKYSEVIQLLSQGKSEEVIHTVIEKFKKLEAKYDYVLVEGSDFSGKGGFTELDVNLMIAKNLGVPALIVGSGNNKTKKEFVNSMQLTYKSFTNKEVDVIGLVANKIEEDEISYIKTKLQKKIPKKVQVDVIPKINFLANPTVKEVVEVYKKRGFDPTYITFEVTETAALHDPTAEDELQQLQSFINELKKLGFTFSLDDFGTGFSSFNYIKHLNVDCIKIDGSFILPIEDSEKDRMFIKAISDLAKGLGLKTVAEFVENEKILAIVKDLGIDMAQGYHLSKPESNLAELCKAFKSKNIKIHYS